MKLLCNILSSSYLGNAPNFSAISLLANNPLSTKPVPIVCIILRHLSLPYCTFILINIVPNPIIPKPICLQSLTDCCCISNGCNVSPSSNTSFNALIHFLTSVLNSTKLKAALSVYGFSTYSAKLIAPNKQLPPAGNGSSAQGLTPANSNSLCFIYSLSKL